MRASFQKKKTPHFCSIPMTFFLYIFFQFEVSIYLIILEQGRKPKRVFSSNYPLVPMEANIIIITSSLCHCFIGPRPYPPTRIKKNTQFVFCCLRFFFFLALPLSQLTVCPIPPPALRALKGTQVPDGSL